MRDTSQEETQRKSFNGDRTNIREELMRWYDDFTFLRKAL